MIGLVSYLVEFDAADEFNGHSLVKPGATLLVVAVSPDQNQRVLAEGNRTTWTTGPNAGQFGADSTHGDWLWSEVPRKPISSVYQENWVWRVWDQRQHSSDQPWEKALWH